MATTWPALESSDGNSGDPAKAAVGEGLFDRDRVVEQIGQTVKVAGSTAATSATTVATFTLRIPEWGVTGRKLRLYVLLGASGGGTAHYRLQDNATATNGTEATTTSTDDPKESALTIPDDTWKETERLFNVQLWETGGGTATAGTKKLMLNLRFGD